MLPRDKKPFVSLQLKMSFSQIDNGFLESMKKDKVVIDLD